MALSRHRAVHCTCPLLGVKQTFQWDSRGKKPNDPLEGFSVPLFGKPLIRLQGRSPLGTASHLRGSASGDQWNYRLFCAEPSTAR